MTLTLQNTNIYGTFTKWYVGGALNYVNQIGLQLS